MSDNPVTPPSISPGSQGLVERAKAILLSPRQTWEQIDAEVSDIKSIYMGYVLPLAAIGPVAAFIGTSVFGAGFGAFSVKIPLLSGLIVAAVSYVLALAMVYVMSLVINMLAPTFGGVKDPLKAFKVAAYSMTAAWLAGIISLVPVLALLALAGAIYSFYLLALGLPRLMKSPPEKTVIYTIAVIVVCIVINLIAATLMTAVTTPLTRLGMQAAGNAGSITLNSPQGTVTLDANRIEDVARQAGAATTQAPLAADGLQSLLPSRFMGASATDLAVSSTEVMGSTYASAQATYEIGDGRIELSIVDMGAMSGLGGMAQAMNINAANETAEGYERVRTEKGRTISENYTHADKSGSYTVLLGGRIAVTAEGTGVEASALKNAVEATDLSRAEAMLK